MTQRKIRTAIVGCGKVAHLHAAALTSLPESDLVAVCDVSYKRAQEFAALYGALAYEDIGPLLAASDAEAIVICTPHPLHAKPALRALAAHRHVLVEKPLAASLADCDAMLAAAQQNRVHLGVVSQRRFCEPVMRMKAAIDAGKIGPPILGSVTMLSWRDEQYYRSDPWRGKWSTEGGGVLINQSPHHLDILRWLMGPVGEITGYAENLSHPYIEVEDTALAMIRFRQGGIGSVMVSLCQQPGIYTKIHVHGANGASVGAETDSGATFIAGMTGVVAPPVNDLWTVPGEEHLLSEFQQQDRAAFQHSDAAKEYHRRQDQDFLHAILDERPPLVTGEEGRAVVEMITAIYQSQREHLPVKLPLTVR